MSLVALGRMSVRFLCFLCLLLTPVSCSCASKCNSLRFRQDKTFKIVQFADLHFGERTHSDKQTRAVQRRILAKEQPDLVILTGDQVSGYAWDGRKGWFAKQWTNVVAELHAAGIPYLTVLGNHDDEADLSRDEIFKLERSHDAATNCSCTRRGPTGITGVSNYYVDVLEPSGNGVGARLWVLDSMDRGCRNVPGWGCVGDDTLRWAIDTASSLPAAPTSLLFVHIPVPQFMTLWNVDTTYGLKEELVSCPLGYGGQQTYDAARMMGVQAIYSGHDHNNDFFGSLNNNMRLAYGRKTGYGSYGPPKDWQHGARVIVLRQGESARHSQTWLRMENGAQDAQKPSRKPWWSPFKQYVCNFGA